MKIHALLLATVIASPAIAAERTSYVHNPDGSVTRVQTTTDAPIDSAESYRNLTPAEQQKLRAAEKPSGGSQTLETSAGGVNYQDRSLTNYQDPYASNIRAYQSNENGVAAEPPAPNVFIVNTRRGRIDKQFVPAETNSYLGY